MQIITQNPILFSTLVQNEAWYNCHKAHLVEVEGISSSDNLCIQVL